MSTELDSDVKKLLIDIIGLKQPDGSLGRGVVRHAAWNFLAHIEKVVTYVG
jgi:hypothetical protein